MNWIIKVRLFVSPHTGKWPNGKGTSSLFDRIIGIVAERIKALVSKTSEPKKFPEFESQRFRVMLAAFNNQCECEGTPMILKFLLPGIIALGIFAAASTPPKELVVAPAIMNEIVSNYDAFPDNEQAYCTYGHVEDTTLVIQGFVTASVSSSDANEVILTEDCQQPGRGFPGNPKYLGVLHTHHVTAKSDIVNPASMVMRRPETIGLACSHFVVLPSGDISHIWTNDMERFQQDSAAVTSMIFCGDRIVWITRDTVEHTLKVIRR